MRVKAFYVYHSLRDLMHWNACADASVKWSVSRETPSIQFPIKLDIHLSSHCIREQSLRRPCPARDLWKRDTLPLSYWATEQTLKPLILGSSVSASRSVSASPAPCQSCQRVNSDCICQSQPMHQIKVTKCGIILRFMQVLENWLLLDYDSKELVPGIEVYVKLKEKHAKDV
ncbi:hypothetical protein TNCV_1086031 [Trichonephila clavipes]|nr:hypothetical protein TNCV_1086031 [Trichonephila clavipes]